MSHHNVSPIVEAAENIESASADIANEAENVKNIAAVRLIDPPLHQDSEHEHGDN